MKGLAFFLILSISLLHAQVTGLAGWNIFVDPGHSITQNMGVNGYSEAEETLQTALHLRELLLTKTDIDTVWSSRYDDQVEVGLTERSTDANNRGAAWFHSIHSNAGSASNNDVLLLWGELWDGTPDPPVGGEAMSDIMVEILSDVMRIPQNGWGSTGDCSFYSPWANTPCTQSGFQGPWLSVNRRTNMPSELSEQGHHTNPLQNQLFMNTDYTRMLAYSMFWTILDKFELTRPYPGILAGIITDVESGLRINGATVQVNGQSYTTDSYESLFHQYSSDPDELRNGFYFFEGIPDSSYEVIFSAPGYYPDTTFINGLSDNFITFLDYQLLPSAVPYVTLSDPADGESNFSAFQNPMITFSRAMDEASVEAAFSISPYAPGEFRFNNSSKRLTYQVDGELEFYTDYVITIAGTAMDTVGHFLDGNQDNIGGDDWSIQFTTGPGDVSAPFITSSFPSPGANDVELQPIYNFVWNEELDSSSADNTHLVILERVSTQQVEEIQLEHHVVNSKSVLTIYVMNELLDSENYRIKILPGFMDAYGNVRVLTTTINFNTTHFNYETTLVDNFENDPENHWFEITQSGSNEGIIPEHTNRYFVTDLSIPFEGDTTALQLDYAWDINASSWLIRQYLNSGPPRAVHFSGENLIQAWVFGDGAGNKFRFCVDDNIGGDSQHEVSPWYTVDWYGWKLITWDMTIDGTGEWLGDGNLEGTLEFDSFQLSYTPGQPSSGTYYIDDLRIADRVYLGVSEEEPIIPSEFALLANYPNPFNPMTSIPFTLAASTKLSIRIFDLRGQEVAQLIGGSLPAGKHITRWDASDVPSGIYLVKLDANDISITRKITVLK